MEFEMAYQTRVAIEKIRFAIRLIEQAGGRVEQTRQVGMQLLEALERLESFERRFQQRSRSTGPEANEGRPGSSNGSVAR